MKKGNKYKVEVRENGQITKTFHYVKEKIAKQRKRYNEMVWCRNKFTQFTATIIPI
jgi:hypothetical protein